MPKLICPSPIPSARASASLWRQPPLTRYCPAAKALTRPNIVPPVASPFSAGCCPFGRHPPPECTGNTVTQVKTTFLMKKLNPSEHIDSYSTLEIFETSCHATTFLLHKSLPALFLLPHNVAQRDHQPSETHIKTKRSLIPPSLSKKWRDWLPKDTPKP